MPLAHYVYILASHSGVLYTGRTTQLVRRILQHRAGAFDGFTRRYRVHRLLHVEVYSRARDAAEREHEIKSWRRAKKLALIDRGNPGRDDLAPGVIPRAEVGADGRTYLLEEGPSATSSLRSEATSGSGLHRP